MKNFFHRVFVYGSLLPGLGNHSVISPYVAASQPGRIRGRLADVGPYPALLLNEAGFVRGLWMDVRLAGMPDLDKLEGFVGIEEENDYDRVWLKDAENDNLSGWCYVWTDPRGFPWFEGEWWPDKPGVVSGRET